MNGWLVYPALLTATIFFWAVVGLPFAVPLARRSKVFLSLAPIFGFCLLAVAGSWYSLLQIPMNRALLLIVALGLGVYGAWLGWRQLRKGQSEGAAEADPELRSKSVGRVVAVATVPWLVGVLGLTVFVIPIVTSALLAGGFLTSFTSTNVDLASYILQGTNLQQAGFGPTDFLVDPDFPQFGSLGDIARFDHTGASALMATTAVAFGLPVWQMATVVLLAVGVCVIPAAFVFAYRVVRIRLRWCMIAATVGTFTTYFWFIQAQGYFPQVALIAILMAQLAVFIWASRVNARSHAIVAGGLLITAGWYISPEVELIAVALIAVAVLAGLLQRPQATRSGLKDVVRALLSWALVVIAAVVVSLVVAIPRIKGAIDVVASTTADAVAGYELNLFGSMSVLLGIDGRAPDEKPLTQIVAQNGTDGLAWLVVMAAVLTLVGLTIIRRDRRAALAFILVAVFAAVAVVGTAKWGPTSYQAWKLIITLSVPTIVLLVGIAFAVARTLAGRQVVAATLLVILGLSLANGQDAWKKNLQSPDALRTYMVSPELVGLLESPFMQRQQGANFRLATVFETMSAPAVYNRPSEMSTPTYFDVNDVDGQGFPFACTVIERSLTKPVRLANTTVVKETPNYLVLGTPDCR